MGICDFSSVMQVISDYISESENINQTDLLQDFIFDDFFHSKESEDFSLDNGLVCKWLNGTAKLSPKIIEYYSLDSNKEPLAADIENLVFPILYDVDMAVSSIYDVLMADITISPQMKEEISNGYPYSSAQHKAEFIMRVLCYGMERTFRKRNAKTKELLVKGTLSPIVKDYIIDGFVPKPCKHFCGRENEIKVIHEMLTEHGEVFVQGVAGIGKSEIVKKYAEVYKNEYSNILYFTYTGDLQQMITDIEFSDDIHISDKDRFEAHNRFLRSLNIDTLLIIDNFDTTATKEPFLDVIRKYKCRIIFTTRSRFDNFAYINLEEFNNTSTLLELVRHFYEVTDKNRNTIENIIEEVHRHTFAVELSARLLASGILNEKQLLRKLQKTKTVLNTEDRIGIEKDGKSSQGTYYEHIHTLISLARLSSKSQKIMRNMTFIPTIGINNKLFAKWLELKNLNEVNDLIELGFIQKDSCRNIYLHPLIQEVAVDDTKPSIDNCKPFIHNIKLECLLHAIDLPYYKNIFYIAENIIKYAIKDNTKTYLAFIIDVFPYMEKYKFKSGMEMILAELEQMNKEGLCNTAAQALIFDYKATMEQHFTNNFVKSLEYQKKAAELSNACVDEKPQLVSNVYANLGSIYLALEMTDEASECMEFAYTTLRNAGLLNSPDGIAQVFNCANLFSELGDYNRAVSMLEACSKVLFDNELYGTVSYANILWGAGLIYMRIGEIEKAQQRIDNAWDIYNVAWRDEPELLDGKLRELQAYALDTLHTSPNAHKLQEFMDKNCYL